MTTGSPTSSGSNSGGSGAAGGASTTGAGGAGNCDPACDVGLECCGGKCINPANDVLNCGGCVALGMGEACPGNFPFCDNGTCGQAPCDPNTTCVGITNCCGNNCCDMGQLCCVVPVGPVGPPMCTAPVDGTCPPGNPGAVCAAPDTHIATPSGERPIAELKEGDLVYSVDGGVVQAVPLVRVSRTAVHDHQVVAVSLPGGVVLHISPGHPTADGRLFGELGAGDTLSGHGVVDVRMEAYGHGFTHDILPDSDSGTYFAGGVLIGSTLASHGAAQVRASLARP
jgi:hypothetical protein